MKHKLNQIVGDNNNINTLVSANHTRIHRGEPLLLNDKCTWFFYVHSHNTQDLLLYVPNERGLVSGHKCQDRNSNPHSADQKHWSLTPVHLSTTTCQDLLCYLLRLCRVIIGNRKLTVLPNNKSLILVDPKCSHCSKRQHHTATQNPDSKTVVIVVGLATC